MTFEGGCYCRQVRYVAAGEPRLKAQTRSATMSQRRFDGTAICLEDLLQRPG
jgi:hypothetical protein